MTNAASQPIDYSDPAHRFNTNGWCAKPEFYGSYMTQEGILVHVLRKGQKVRFYDDRGHQYGPEHKNLVPAIYWVYGATEWFDPGDVLFTVECRKEVRANSTYRRSQKTDVEPDGSDGAFNPARHGRI